VVKTSARISFPQGIRTCWSSMLEYSFLMDELPRPRKQTISYSPSLWSTKVSEWPSASAQSFAGV